MDGIDLNPGNADSGGSGGAGGSDEGGGSGDGSGESVPDPEKNEYGFYFNQPYQMTQDGALVEYVFYADGSASAWMSMEDQHQAQYFPAGTCAYAPGAIDLGGMSLAVSEDGKSVSADGASMTVDFVTESNIQYGVMYENAAEGMAFVFKDDGSLELYGGGALQTTLPAGSVALKEHSIELTAGSDTLVCPVYPDGSKLLFQEMVLCVSMPKLETPVISLSERVLTITPVENATGYEVYIDDELICTTTEATVDLSSKLGDDDSCYVKVRAVGSSSYKASAYNKVWFSLTVLEPGLYDANDGLLASWDELVNDYGLDVESDYTGSNKAGQAYYVLNHNTELSAGVKLIVSPDVDCIGDRAFESCRSLTSITIPDSVTTIGDYAFYNCRGLSSMTIPDCITSIGDSAFAACPIETVVYRGTLEQWLNIAFNALGANPCFNGASLYINSSELVDNIIIPASVTNISNYAFQGCTSLESITIPDCVTSIGDYSFNKCTNLTSVSFSENSQLTRIGKDAFEQCTSLASVEFPVSLTSIGDYAFNGCTGLANIKYAGSTYEWTKNVSKGMSWNNSGVPATEVVCSDGVVSLVD